MNTYYDVARNVDMDIYWLKVLNQHEDASVVERESKRSQSDAVPTIETKSSRVTRLIESRLVDRVWAVKFLE